MAQFAGDLYMEKVQGRQTLTVVCLQVGTKTQLETANRSFKGGLSKVLVEKINVIMTSGGRGS